MGLKKGMSNFKSKQQATLLENTQKIEQALSEMPKSIDKLSLSKVIYFVSDKTGLHVTTIKKNENYIRMCEDVYLNLMKVKGANNPKEVIELKKSVRTLELENANLKNQVTSLSNVVKRLESSEVLPVSTDESKYKEATLALLQHFKDQLQVINGEVVDPYSGVRPKLICIIERKIK